VPEVDPFALVQLAGEVGQRLLDHVLGAVDGARVADHPVVDVLADGVDAALDHFGLVADDHGEADRGPLNLGSTHARVRLPTATDGARSVYGVLCVAWT